MFTVKHTATRHTLPGPAYGYPHGISYNTRKEAEAEAKKWLPWFYSVSFKQPRSPKLRWVDVSTQDVNTATAQANDYARRRGIKGEVYGVSKISQPTKRIKTTEKGQTMNNNPKLVHTAEVSNLDELLNALTNIAVKEIPKTPVVGSAYFAKLTESGRPLEVKVWEPSEETGDDSFITISEKK